MNKDGLYSLAFVWLVVQIWYRDLASENGEVTISCFSSQSSFFSSCAVDGGPNRTPVQSMAGQIEPPRRRWWHRPTRCGRWSPTSPRSPPPPATLCPHALLLQQLLIPHHGRQRGAEESPRAHRSMVSRESKLSSVICCQISRSSSSPPAQCVEQLERELLRFRSCTSIQALLA